MTTFTNITRSFLAQFTTRIAKAKHPINLLGVTQRNREPTRKYLDRFNDECLEIDGLTDSVASLCLTNGLSNEDFRNHSTTKPVWTMQDIQNVAREYINDKEPTRASCRNPINSRTEPAGNKSLYCDYHKGFGHKTQDCFDLKDALEQAIREGKLTEFSQFIREPKRRECERSDDDKSQAVKPRQEPDEDNDCGLTIVNVVVGRDTAPRSKSATRKDAEILAVSSSNHGTTFGKAPRISFGPEDQWSHDIPENLPMVITPTVGTGLVKRILVDTRVDSNIMFKNIFDALSFREIDLKTHHHGVVGLGDNFIKPDDVVSLPIRIDGGRSKRSVMAEFVVLRDSTAYNVILE
ncbi:uncharacterized protein LOC130975437 [Arachis stenosperma]|uniref:uncharacterized protein LOC130975437 n=1 Tax=Arachis stenosperma TaxID=217475 RepID=UPI0025AD15D0|nr:uncharacterized protein LOC130975437 [Arachis stenosperma]